MELRPRKDRNSSASKLPPPSPTMSGKAKIQQGSSRMASASLPSRSKPARAQNSSSSIVRRTLICLSSEEENNGKSESSMFKKKDATPIQNCSRSADPRSPIMVSTIEESYLKEMSGRHKTSGNDVTPQSRLTRKGRLQSSTGKMVAEVTKEVDENKIISRAGKEDASMRPQAPDEKELESNSMEATKRSISKVNGESRKRTPSRSISQKGCEINRKLFEDVVNGEMDHEDINCRSIELSHQNEDEKSQTIIGDTVDNSPCWGTVLLANGPKEKSNRSPENVTNGVEERTNTIHSGNSTATVLIANGHQEKPNQSPANLTNIIAEAEQTTLVHMLPDKHVYQMVDGRETDCMDLEDKVEKARSLREKEELTAEIRQLSCANMHGSILGEVRSEHRNGGSLQFEGYGGIGSGFKPGADLSPEKGLKAINAPPIIIEQKTQEPLENNCDRFLCTKSGKETSVIARFGSSSHRENNQELSLDDNANFCGIKGGRGEKEAENQGLALSGKKETKPLEAFMCHGSDRLTDNDKDNDTEQDDSEADGTTFQGSSSDLSMKRKEEDNDDNEDEEEMAKLFVRSLKAHLRQISGPSGVVNMQKEVAAKVGQCEEEENIFRKVAAKEVGQITCNGSRMSNIGLSWFPETGLLATKPDKCLERDCIGTLRGVPETIWQKEGKLIDGLLVPPLDPNKLNKLSRKQTKDTAGAKWYDLSAPTVTPELKRELQLLKLRNVIDPKRHYKSEDSKGLPKYFQVGTVVGGPADFYSGRLTKKEQKNTLSAELLSDSILSAYRKRKYTEIQDQKQAGGKKFGKKKKNKRTPSWART